MERSRVAVSESNFSLPIVTRLDHMDFIIKYLERKQKLGSHGASAVRGNGGQGMPWDMALKKAQSKGTLLDRVASLEHRLFQLCMETESSSSSRPMSCTSTQSFGGCSSSQSSQGNTSGSSASIFNNSLPDQGERRVTHLQIIRTPETQEEKERVQLKSTGHISVPEKQLVKQKSIKEDSKKCKGIKKKRVTASWSRIKLLGC